MLVYNSHFKTIFSNHIKYINFGLFDRADVSLKLCQKYFFQTNKHFSCTLDIMLQKGHNSLNKTLKTCSFFKF